MKTMRIEVQTTMGLAGGQIVTKFKWKKRGWLVLIEVPTYPQEEPESLKLRIANAVLEAQDYLKSC